MLTRSPWTLAAALLACTPPAPPTRSPEPPPVQPAPAEEPTAVALAAEPADYTLMHTALSPVTLSVAASKTCKPLHLTTDGHDKFVGFGKRGTFVRLLPDGKIEDLTIPRSHPFTADVGTVTAVEAAWDDRLLVRVDDPHSPVGAIERIYLRADRRWSLLPPVEHATRWLGGSVLAAHKCWRTTTGRCKPLDLEVFGGAATTPVPQFPDLPQLAAATVERTCVTANRFTARLDGQFFASAKLCDDTNSSPKSAWYALRWSPADGPQVDPLPYDPGLEWTPGPVAMAAPDRLLATANVTLGSRRHAAIARFDGGAWSLLPALTGHAVQLAVDPEGAIWLLLDDGAGATRIVRGAPGGEWTRLAFPDRPVEFGGLDGAWSWIREQGGGLWLRPSAGKFARVSLPALDLTPQQTARRVTVIGDEVFVAAQSYEQMPKRTTCTVLLRSGTGTLLPDIPG